MSATGWIFLPVSFPWAGFIMLLSGPRPGRLRLPRRFGGLGRSVSRTPVLRQGHSHRSCGCNHGCGRNGYPGETSLDLHQGFAGTDCQDLDVRRSSHSGVRHMSRLIRYCIGSVWSQWFPESNGFKAENPMEILTPWVFLSCSGKVKETNQPACSR